MTLLAMALKNLRRRPMRSLFTLLGIAVAVAAFVSLVGLSRGFENAWMNALLERDTHAYAVPKGVIDLLSASIDESAGEAMLAVDGVVEVSGELADMVDLDTSEMIIVAGWPLGSYLWRSVELAEGRLPGPGDGDGVILGRAVADNLGYRVGDSFAIKMEDFTVLGIVDSAGVMRNHAMVMSLAALQELNNRHGQVSTLNFRFDDYRDRARAADILARLRAAFPDYTFTETLDLADGNKVLALFRAMAWSTSTIALFIGLVVMINTLLMSVMERTRELGLLAAIGWPAQRVLRLILLEGVALSALGGGLGLVGGIGGLRLIAAAEQMRGLIEPAVDFRLFVEVGVAVVLLGLVGSLYPAWRAVRLRPADALRYE